MAGEVESDWYVWDHSTESVESEHEARDEAERAAEGAAELEAVDARPL